ncbi:ATP phosphoribosyltransferase catalytic subunit [Caloramator quimbayensis]|uniref:ATP phosphoribosyltransferase n=1 Tax=Caloramator quimbayensis TaxID=1147123 RepID=A0A1T4X5N0_9CLOT|nr:ATP phosphoribosyltransferase [Caloramator quimbayensis]SKA84924.1 ATP phosphoribosyltransferase catalytic subunit [Caloramator quimbayensis]
MDYITIAVAKGRIANITIKKLEENGLIFSDFKNSRKLIFEDDNSKIKIILVKADDVPIYVEYGAADIGIVGKDTLLETDCDVYEIFDLGYGKCRFAIASLKDFEYKKGKKLRVATKYPNVAKDYFNKKKEPVEILKLNGSVELAPIVGISDVIVDIVETGTTLKENGLVILEEICPVSARLISNKASYKSKSDRIYEIVDCFRRHMNENDIC